ncbi:hypothetical protein BpHYR1_042014 [Brachionus plicatilis]|uniref:Uncharacterized protein n=1 Tax=Brachionus plicatilis TaxID=10195 RepID=A0A3M7P704_BRAPC|nr:hypothetical protein BpHYR1_042014 [Brachionus plicatilis]
MFSNEQYKSMPKHLSGDKTEPRSHSELPTALSPCSSDHSTPTISSITSNPLLNQHKQGDYHQIVAPKPFKKTYPTSNQTEDMNTESLIEKRKNQLNLILNWTLSANTVIAEIISPDSSKSTSIDDLAIENNQAESSSLSPISDQKNSLDSLSEIALDASKD